MQLDCRHLTHPAKQQVIRFSLDRVVNPLSRLVYASNCGGFQPSQINCARHERLGVSSPPVESNSPGCSDEAAGATGIVVRRTGVRREPSSTGKWLSIRKAWPALSTIWTLAPIFLRSVTHLREGDHGPRPHQLIDRCPSQKQKPGSDRDSNVGDESN